MRFKRLLALLLAAALALSLLVGCGGRNQSLSQMLLNLLDGQYQNVSVEIDSDLEAKLRQAISQSETDEELRAALEQLLGGGISFQRLGSGQQGDTAWDLIIYPGTDPNAAARSVYLDLDKVFAALPDDGVYSSGFAMAEMENGYAILVKATVDKAGTEDKPDPVTLKSIEVTKDPTKTKYYVNETFDPTGMVITATYSNGTTKTISDITASDKKGVSWTPDGALTTKGSHEITITYGDKTTTVSVTVEEPTVKSLTVELASLTYTAGASFTLGDITKVTATYTNNKMETVLPENCDFYLGSTKITLPHQFTTVGSYTLTVSYKGGEAEIPLTVNFGTVTSITVSGPTKTEYEVGQTFSSAGLVVTAHDGYGNVQTIPKGDYTLAITDPDGDPFDPSSKFTTEGTYTLTVEYNKIKSAPITITVEHKGYIYDENSKTYYVSNENGLLAWNEAVQDDLTLNCTLTADINLAGKEWTPIGTDDNNSYNGTFDGNGKTITGLTVNQSEKNYAGLFGCLGSDGKVQNLTLENVDISGAFYVGSIVGTNFGTVSGCTASGNITGTESCIGGVVGQNKGTVTGCTVSGNISSKQYTGGVVGENFGTVSACYHATGDVTGNINYVGGVVGWNYYGTVTACYHVNGNVTATYNWVGSVAGFNGGVGSVTACYWNDSPDPGIGYDNGSGQATKVDGTDVTWADAVDAMNTALQSAGSEWRYELTGDSTLPSLTKTTP